MSQIKIQDILPLLKPGFVAMNEWGEWFWYRNKPILDNGHYTSNGLVAHLHMINITPYEGDWKDSLMECGK